MSEDAFDLEPIALFDECLDCREKYRKSITELGLELLQSVVRWRWANDKMLPIHPLFHEVNTDELDGPWKASKRKWLAKKPKSEFDGVKNGFNEGGEIVAMFRPRGEEYLVVRGENYFDVLAVESNSNRTEFKTPSRHDAWFDRYFVNDDGRIVGIASCDGQYLSTQSFQYKNGQVAESLRQMFNRDDAPVNEEHKILLADGTRQSRVSSKLEYSYAPNGALKHVVVYRSNVEGVFAEVYVQRKEDTVLSVTKEAVTKLSEFIIDHFENAAIPQPLHRIILVYSAEHGEGGLPSRVAYLSGKVDFANAPERLFDAHDEAYQWLEWPPASRRMEFGSLTDRLYLLVDEMDDIPGGDAPLAFREMLWKACTKIYKELSKAKTLVSKDFLVYPLDDHEDVDAEEDLRQSVPKSVARHVLDARK